MSNVSRNEMLVGVDIGTSKVVSIVAETRGNTLEVIGLGTHSSKGLKNGVVVDIDSNGEGYIKGIREGDIIKNVGTERVESVKEFNRLIEKSRQRGTVLILVKKPNGGSRFYTLDY